MPLDRNSIKGWGFTITACTLFSCFTAFFSSVSSGIGADIMHRQGYDDYSGSDAARVGGLGGLAMGATLSFILILMILCKRSRITAPSPLHSTGRFLGSAGLLAAAGNTIGYPLLEYTNSESPQMTPLQMIISNSIGIPIELIAILIPVYFCFRYRENHPDSNFDLIGRSDLGIDGDCCDCTSTNQVITPRNRYGGV